MNEKTPATVPDPQQGLKDKKAMLEQKLKDIESKSFADVGHDKEESRRQIQRHLAEVNAALKKETK